MSIILSLLLIGVSLSMDTFSVSLSIGTFSVSKKQMLFLSLLVGILHFFMPLLGSYLGNKILNFLKIDANFLLGIILLFIAVEMILSINKDNNYFSLNIINILLISFSVSLDSLSTGIGLSAVTNDFFLACSIISTCAFLFTVLGLIVGKYSSERLGKSASIIGIILLIIISFIHIIK